MSPLVRLATATLVVCASLALPASPAHSADTLQRSVQSTSLLPQPDLPLPEVPVPSVPLPEVPVPNPPPVPPVPQVPNVPPPAVSPPDLSSPPQPAARAPQKSEQSGPQPKAQAAAGRQASGGTEARRGATAGSPGPGPVIAQVDHAQRAPAFNNAEDDYLLGLVHDELCAALPALLNAKPETVVGLPARVIAQLPPEIVNVVPEQVLARATVRCSAAEPAGAEEEGLLTRVLGMHPRTGMVGAAALPIGLALLSLGIGLRVTARSGGHNKTA